MDSHGIPLQDLIDNPNYDFIQQLIKDNDLNDDDYNYSDSPYDNSSFLCSYVDPLNYKITYNPNSLSFMSLNIQSLHSKFNEFSDLIALLEKDKCAPDVICLQELWQFPEFAKFSLLNYHPLCYKLRNKTQGGGVGIYVRSTIKFKILPEISVFVDRILESLFIEIVLDNNKIYTVGSVYRPGSTHPTLTQTESFNEFSNLFANICDTITSNKHEVVVLGDFNIDVLQYNSNCRSANYVDLLFSFGLLQLITKPTRCCDNSATLLDHVVTNVNAPSFVTSVLTSRISDHFPIIFSLQSSFKPTEKTKVIQSRDFSIHNELAFKRALNNINWNQIRDETDVQVAYNTFSDIFHNLYDLHFPIKTCKFNR